MFKNRSTLHSFDVFSRIKAAFLKGVLCIFIFLFIILLFLELQKLFLNDSNFRYKMEFLILIWDKSISDWTLNTARNILKIFFNIAAEFDFTSLNKLEARFASLIPNNCVCGHLLADMKYLCIS